MEPTDPLSALRATVSAMTPGEWVRLHDAQKTRAVVVLSGDDKLKGALVEQAGHTNKCQCGQIWSLAVDWPVAYCDTRQQREGPTGKARMANATGIVTAVQIARFVADPESVEKVARTLARERCGPSGERLADAWVDRNWITFTYEAEAVLTLIARAANAE
jgi:hypothetical protein